jgi:carboxyl-terminal processing protease
MRFMRASPGSRAGSAAVFGWLAAALLAACATQPGPPPEPPGRFSKEAAREVFAAGYGSIAEKYIEAVSLRALGVEGVRGLGTIDPSLTVEETADGVQLSQGGRAVARFPSPADNDADGWAQVTTDAVFAGRRVSPGLRQADDERLYEAVFDGVLGKLDMFSRYASSVEAAKNRANRDGFGGVGLKFEVQAANVVVTEVMPETPAERAGVLKGDRITHVGDVPVTGMKAADITEQLRGPVLSRVALQVLREGRPEGQRIEIERALILPPTVTERHENGVIHLHISGFNQDTARSVAAKIKAAQRDMAGGLGGIVLDLRGNPGGLLRQSVKVADLFLTRGAIVSTRGRHPDSVQFYEATGTDVAEGAPIVVLMDARAASAAEIVAAALQDQDRAVVVGTGSFGKGTVQTVVRLPNDGEMTLTWSRLVAPSGYSLHGLGIVPAVCTSGIAADAENAVETTLATRARAPGLERAREEGAFDDEAKRRQIRDACPPERRTAKIDVDVARRLLGDSALYARLLEHPAATAEARY